MGPTAGHYEEALDLDAHMARMARKYSDIAVVRNIAADVKRSTRFMLTQLLQVSGARRGYPISIATITLPRLTFAVAAERH